MVERCSGLQMVGSCTFQVYIDRARQCTTAFITELQTDPSVDCKWVSLESNALGYSFGPISCYEVPYHKDTRLFARLHVAVNRNRLGHDSFYSRLSWLASIKSLGLLRSLTNSAISATASTHMIASSLRPESDFRKITASAESRFSAMMLVIQAVIWKLKNLYRSSRDSSLPHGCASISPYKHSLAFSQTMDKKSFTNLADLLEQMAYIKV